MRRDYEEIDYDQYNRFNCPIVSESLFPEDYKKYPLVIASDDESAIIAVNRYRGFIVHRDGTRIDSDDLEKLFLSTKMPVGSQKWSRDMLAKMIKNKTL